ncbi:hypothetical protein RHEph03_gp003 [Rhizobium phage RHEph03]|uniref:Uncharacterized protein n=1 Tax=Rhizobium phage RHEph03 TaxID=1220603 RepID=L7TKL3_9CAUD|nr:hypothetical protein RHEph03_gp003 [Rhizobium phage RHEph03]
MLNVLMLRGAAIYVARAAVSAGVGVIAVSAITKAGSAVHHEIKMYRAYRAAYQQAEREYDAAHTEGDE